MTRLPTIMIDPGAPLQAVPPWPGYGPTFNLLRPLLAFLSCCLLLFVPSSFSPRPSVPRSPAGAARKVQQRKGQFWTPPWIAEAMASYVLAGGATMVFDPAVGAGAFQRAVLRVSSLPVRLLGCEIDPGALAQARESGLSEEDLRGVRLADFVTQAPPGEFPAILGNPPYLRHHRLEAEQKRRLQEEARALLGARLDARAGLHVYFLLRALDQLAPRGRLAFVVPGDTVEGVFSSTLWGWIARHYRMDGVITFAPEATPFPGVDINPLVLLLRREPPLSHFPWVRVLRREGTALRQWLEAGLPEGGAAESFQVCKREVAEALETGLSRPPEAQTSGPWKLGDLARVVRGIATGNNEFFHLSETQVEEWKIPREFLRPAIARSRDVAGDCLRPEDLEALAGAGRPTLLLALDGREESSLPEAVRRYLAWGRARGVHQGTLVMTRRPWYKMEHREVPPFLFAYLGMRSSRFLRNRAGVVPLSGFLCVYPHERTAQGLDRLGLLLSHPRVLAGLARVGKVYGSGAIKVEPRALERLPIPEELLHTLGIPLPEERP